MFFSSIKGITRLINPFPTNVPILYPLKTPENQRLSRVFRGYKIGTLAKNGLISKEMSSIYLKVTSEKS